MGWFSFFGRMSQIFVSAAQSKKWYCLGFSGEPSSCSISARLKKVQNGSYGAEWQAAVSLGYIFYPKGQTLTVDYYINNILEAGPSPYKREWSNRQAEIVQFQSPRAWRSSKTGRQHTQPRPPRHGAKKKPVKFYRENMLAPKFPRY